VVSSTPLPLFAPGERVCGTHPKGGWLDPEAGLDDMEKYKIRDPRDSNLSGRTMPCAEITHFTFYIDICSPDVMPEMLYAYLLSPILGACLSNMDFPHLELKFKSGYNVVPQGLISNRL
jgi:hypothetical protein